MTRICGLNPGIDYHPVRWALREFRQDTTPRVRETVEAETTVTAYEGLSDDDRAALLILNGRAHYRFIDQTWTIQIDLKGQRISFAFQEGHGYTLKSFIGYLLDHGHCPALDVEIGC